MPSGIRTGKLNLAGFRLMTQTSWQYHALLILLIESPSNSRETMTGYSQMYASKLIIAAYTKIEMVQKDSITLRRNSIS